MTTDPARSISSAPILRAALWWGIGVGAILLVVAATVGYLVAGSDGLWSAVAGATVGIVFPALTAGSIMLGNRWFGTPYYLQIFFAVVLGGWLLKFVIVIVALVVLSNLAWVVPLVFYLSLVGAAVASLVVDLVVISRMRLSAASDVRLPGEQDGPESGTRPDF
ncbi:hypothetical protein RYJ27_08215 [Microbacterium limosum]|uniref:ATP synthase protein I n=1 Tax=Microbacterium limosum TaxID=3079935 RepID=A0AAU0MDV1_9MICO|nr:hypothetical protein [Microbacterium sp. Y20]WOQ68703.1 hypothetical protein RYJ27_08215 [Microbacterium sp. Y20]